MTTTTNNRITPGFPYGDRHNPCNPGRRLKPNAWKTGTDVELHVMYHNYARARAQANHRREPWNFDFDSWVQAWQGRFSERGRRKESICLCRRDTDLPWSLENTQLLNRQEHALRQAQLKAQGISHRKPRL